jgi:hypothetical protein
MKNETITVLLLIIPAYSGASNILTDINKIVAVQSVCNCAFEVRHCSVSKKLDDFWKRSLYISFRR